MRHPIPFLEGGLYEKKSVYGKPDCRHPQRSPSRVAHVGKQVKCSGSMGRRTRAHALMSGLCRRKRRMDRDLQKEEVDETPRL